MAQRGLTGGSIAAPGPGGGLADFWAVYDRHFEEIAAQVLEAVRHHAEFGALVSALTPEQIAEEGRRSRELIGSAIAGDRAEYEADLRVKGAAYAQAGVRFSSWFDLFSAWQKQMLPYLVDTYAADRGRLAGALFSMRVFLDRGLVVIAEEYQRTRERLAGETAERRAAELERSEEHHRHLFMNSPLPSWVFDVETLAFLAVNEAAVAHYGYSREEFLRMTIRDIRPPEDVAPLEAALVGAPVLETAVLRRHRLKSGEVISVEISAHTFTLDGTPARLVVAHDISARERAVERLRYSEASFARLSESGIIGTLITDVKGPILEANDAFLAMVGWERGELLARGFDSRRITPPEWNDVTTILRRQLEERGLAAPMEKEYFRKDGSRVPVLVGLVRLDATRVVSFVLDMTERKRLEQLQRDSREIVAENARVQEGSRLKSELLANMSHELRTPLNAILGFGELLYDGEVPPGSALHREFLADILISGRHLLQLINDVLDLAKVEAGRMQFRPESVDLESVAFEVTAMVRTQGAAKQIRTTVDIDPALRAGIFLDPGRLKQILYNYLSNALKFTPEGGCVAVRARPEGDDAFRLEVEDNGPGIAPSDLKRLFVEFQQLDEGSGKSHGGTGLGLALTRRLAEAQGGSVGLRSTLGQGSVFHAILPRRSPVGTEPRQPPPPPRPEGRTVLVIDDDPGSLKLMEVALAQLGYESRSLGAEEQARLGLSAQRVVKQFLPLRPGGQT